MNERWEDNRTLAAQEFEGASSFNPFLDDDEDDFSVDLDRGGTVFNPFLDDETDESAFESTEFRESTPVRQNENLEVFDRNQSESHERETVGTVRTEVETIQNRHSQSAVDGSGKQYSGALAPDYTPAPQAIGQDGEPLKVKPKQKKARGKRRRARVIHDYDLEMLSFLALGRYSTSSQIGSALKARKTPDSAYKRLRKLQDSNLVTQMEGPGGKIMWKLSPYGRAFVTDEGLVPTDQMAKDVIISDSGARHQIYVNQVLACVLRGVHEAFPGTIIGEFLKMGNWSEDLLYENSENIVTEYGMRSDWEEARKEYEKVLKQPQHQITPLSKPWYIQKVAAGTYGDLALVADPELSRYEGFSKNLKFPDLAFTVSGVDPVYFEIELSRKKAVDLDRGMWIYHNQMHKFSEVVWVVDNASREKDIIESAKRVSKYVEYEWINNPERLGEWDGQTVNGIIGQKPGTPLLDTGKMKIVRLTDIDGEYWDRRWWDM